MNSRSAGARNRLMARPAQEPRLGLKELATRRNCLTVRALVGNSFSEPSFVRFTTASTNRLWVWKP